jgi:hypothetical protein
LISASPLAVRLESMTYCGMANLPVAGSHPLCGTLSRVVT